MSELLKKQPRINKRERAQRSRWREDVPVANPQTQQLAYLLPPANQKIFLNLELNVRLNEHCFSGVIGLGESIISTQFLLCVEGLNLLPVAEKT